MSGAVGEIRSEKYIVAVLYSRPRGVTGLNLIHYLGHASGLARVVGWKGAE